MQTEKNTDAIITQVHSDSMDRELPMMVFLPKSYHQNDKPYPTVELLHGWSSQWNDIRPESLHGLYPPTHGMQELADEWQVIIAAPVTGNNFYLDSPINSKIQMATYAGKEVPAFMDANYRTIANREGRIIAGFSMGGFGAVSTICKYPETFRTCAIRAAVTERGAEFKSGKSQPYPEMIEIVGTYKGNEQFYDSQCNCSALMQNLAEKDVAMVIECGRDDSLLDHSKQLRDTTQQLEIPLIYAEYPGGHQWGHQPFRNLLCHVQQFCHTTLWL